MPTTYNECLCGFSEAGNENTFCLNEAKNEQYNFWKTRNQNVPSPDMVEGVPETCSVLAISCFNKHWFKTRCDIFLVIKLLPLKKRIQIFYKYKRLKIQQNSEDRNFEKPLEILPWLRNKKKKISKCQSEQLHSWSKFLKNHSAQNSKYVPKSGIFLYFLKKTPI